MTALIFLLIFVELVIVSWIDFKTKKIWNKWSFVNLGLAVVFFATFTSLYPLSWEVLIFPLGFIAVGFLLYLLNIMGAGDSKFLASLFLVVPLELHIVFLEKLILSTLVTGSTLLVSRIWREWSTIKSYLISHHWKGIIHVVRSRFSYAPVILVAWILLGVSQWN
jgi:prepilin peptidase CpaA